MVEINSIRKAEIHCHVDGLLDPEILERVLKQQVEIGASPEELEAVYPAESLDDWLKNYTQVVSPRLVNRAEVILAILVEHLDRLKQQNVVYTEIMLSSFHGQLKDVQEQMQLYKLFCDTCSMNDPHPLQVEFLFAFGRGKTRERYERLAERILKAYELGYICGVALAGFPETASVRPISDIFRRFKEAGLGIEIHAGEVGGPESVWDALEYGFADRIGHGLAIIQDPVLQKHVEDNQIHIEFCPTSNVILTDIPSIEEHPVRTALERGWNFSVNTDDPGPFGCSMNSEFNLLHQTFGFTENDFERIFRNCIEATFAQEPRLADN